ncbi:phage tail assembly chaperone [uncultured Sphingomonas sp.]|uniref:phage tail assembly chaperone n=1 Tax=uncultured Sphingomonas sp. TaxID=158754 RepID=UPI0035CA4649
MKPPRPAGALPGAFDVTVEGPTVTFAAAAARLAGAAGALLGWRPGEFWAATPAELACVIRALAGDGAGDEAGGKAPPATPPDAGTIRRLMEAFPDG